MDPEYPYKRKPRKTSQARLTAAQKYYDKNKETILAKAREKYKEPEYREKVLEKRRAEQKKKTAEEKWAKGIWWKYKIRPHQYWEMFEDQGGVCGICGVPPNDRRLCVDHCHTTGEVRGLLCVNCNAALGQMKDTEQFVINTFNYLRRVNNAKFQSTCTTSR